MHQGSELVKPTGLRGAARHVVLSGCLAAMTLAVALAGPAAAAAACPNESLRAGAPQLADCRAYEMVSPVDMNGNGIEQAFAVRPDGNAIAYGTINVFGDAPSSIAGKWIAARGAGEWSSSTINAPTPGRVPSAYDEPVALAFSADLSSALIGSRYPFDPLDQAPYINFTSSGNADVYQVWPGGRMQWLSHGPVLPDTNYIDRGLSGASADLSRVFFQTKEELTAETAGSTAQNLYEREGAALRVVNVDEEGHLIPGGGATGRGTATAASFYAGGEYAQGATAQGQPFDPTAVSTDGSHVFFTAPLEPTSAPRQLYLRIDASRTVLVSRCRFGACAGEGAPDGALFLFARPDGSAVTFYSADRLTEAAPEGGGIYRFDVAAGSLAFLTALDTSVGPSFRHGGLLAASEDGSYLYLCEGGTEVSVYHAGAVRAIAPIPCDAAGDPDGADEPRTARRGSTVAGVKGITQGEPSRTSDVGYLFATTAGPAAMGNEYPNEGHSEVYFYDARTASLHCLSCRADGAPAQADSFLNDAAVRPEKTFVTIPSPAGFGVAIRNLSAAGDRAFFVSEESLAADDADESQDVYEWEAAGRGTCTTAAAAYVPAAAGCVTPVSTEAGAAGAVLEGASEDGDDVFFATYASLVPADTGTELQLYDARVDGGLPAQHPVASTPCADADRCRGEGHVGGPSPTPAATAHHSGPGNSRRLLDCSPQRRRARALRAKARRARRLAHRARAHGNKRKARKMTRRSRRFTAKARRHSHRARRCAKADGGAEK